MEFGENKMDSFLDSAVIINYLEYEYIKEQLRKKCFEYIKNQDGKILLSFIVEDELHKVILKRKEIYECVLRKIKDPSYEINCQKTVYLKKEDTIFAQSLYLKLKKESITRLKKDFDSEIDFLNASLSLFLKNKVNEIDIHKSDLEESLLSIIHNFIEDFADCRVLTSAMQMQKNRAIFLFATADEHFAPNDYEFLKNEPKLEDYKKPILKNLLYEN